LVSTVAPRVVFDAVLTTVDVPSLDDAEVLDCELGEAAVLACEEEPEPLELLPHAARVNDTARAGRRNFRIGRIGTPFAKQRTGTLAVHRPGTVLEDSAAP
jgi:hypothetical protein